VELCLDRAQDVPDTTFTDPNRLRQILLNLVGNAIKFAKGGRVQLAARMAAGAEPRPICFEVRDTGIGLSEEEISRLFEPFAQTRPAPAQGTGLGLAISKRLAALLGGDITVTSVPGAGSTFTLTIEGRHLAQPFAESTQRAALQCAI
jgi:signal transduction histidine kinase